MTKALLRALYHACAEGKSIPGIKPIKGKKPCNKSAKMGLPGNASLFHE
jgi:hypothetical protein